MSDKIERLVIVALITLGITTGVALAWVAAQKSRQAESLRDAYEIVAQSPSPVIVCKGGRITLVNSAAETALGVSADKLVGQMAALTVVSPQYKQRHDEAIKRLSILPPGSRGSKLFVMPLRGADGEVRKWLVSSSYQIMSNGELVTRIQLENYLAMNRQLWTDIETGEKVQAVVSLRKATRHKKPPKPPEAKADTSTRGGEAGPLSGS